MTTEDHARDGVPVGTRPPPNLLPPFILVSRESDASACLDNYN